MDKEHKSYWWNNKILPKTSSGTGITKTQTERICPNCQAIINKGELYWNNKIVFCKKTFMCMSCRQRKLDEL